MSFQMVVVCGELRLRGRELWRSRSEQLETLDEALLAAKVSHGREQYRSQLARSTTA